MLHMVSDEIKSGKQPPRMIPMTKDGICLPVGDALRQIADNPGLWDQHTLRTEAYPDGNPHDRVHDIWVRYRDYADLDRANPAKFLESHHSVWYPAYGKLPALGNLIFPLMTAVRGEQLGGVLITRIPPGCSVGKHKDLGWHAGYYNRKFAVMLKSDHKQAFCFDGERMLTDPGEIFEFDNSREHWVENNSDQDRMTMIVCIHTSLPPKDQPKEADGGQQKKGKRKKRAKAAAAATG